jgi:hypothetical protein
VTGKSCGEMRYRLLGLLVQTSIELRHGWPCLVTKCEGCGGGESSPKFSTTTSCSRIRSGRPVQWRKTGLRLRSGGLRMTLSVSIAHTGSNERNTGHIQELIFVIVAGCGAK